MDENELPQDGTNPEPEVVEETIEETIDAPLEKTYTQAEWDELHGRAVRAEATLKAKQKVNNPPTPVSPLNVEETVLLANGMSEELLGELKVVAQVRKTSLIKAQADPIFIAVKEKFDKDQKHEDASLPASRGAGNTKVQKNFSTPGLSREEHKAMLQNFQS